MAQRDDKLSALRAAHAVNPRSHLVTDPVFLTGQPFFDARDLVQVKYEMLRRVQVDAHSVTQAAMALGFSRPSFYAALAAWQRAGLPGRLRAAGLLTLDEVATAMDVCPATFKDWRR